ncbi:PLP-dependent transferase, partial [Anaerotruncus colihominis]
IVLKELRLFKHWVSLGEAHSLISPKDADPEKGIPADFIRVSAGLENSGDLIADLEQAFSKVRW